MLKRLSLGILSIVASLSAVAAPIATDTVHALNMSMDYELHPNQSHTFINYMFWTIDADCKIESQDSSNKLVVVALAKKGKVNEVPLETGQSLEITVVHDQVLKLSAESGAKVEITNYGEHTIKASCITN
ncbi:MAG: hypothetical protein BGO90_12465 [Legionella sp. 40-6]|nr:hypothetical protein [Legionella sp.]OJY46017.1 MAG: hypothetical protein BGO90_12465 [Legionella sp. 40-6]